MNLEELKGLDDVEVLYGYEQARRGYELSGYETKSFVHGWRNGRCDFHGVPPNEAQMNLAREFVKSSNQK